MAKKLITFGEEARTKLYEGIDNLSRAVGSTLGAKGNTVLYQHGDEPTGVPLVTKDGVTVAKQITFEDPLMAMGANLVKEAANKTVQRAGDGTTTATVLTQAILQESGLDTSLEFINGLDDAYKEVLKYLEKEAKEVDSTLLKFVAKVSCNNDEELGDLISDAIDKAGEYGTVGWEVNMKNETTYVEVEDGSKIPSGYMDRNFVNVQKNELVMFDDAYVFVSSAKIQDIEQVKPIIKVALGDKEEGTLPKPLVFIADFEPRVAATILQNVTANGMKFSIVRPPSFGPLQQEMLEDIADLVGCTLHGHHLGDELESDQTRFMGTCKQIMSTSSDTIIRFDKKPDLSEKVENIQALIAGDETTMRKRQLKERLAMLAGSIGNIYVGAPSEIELKEKYDRVEDAVYAVYAAKDEGILPGGGVALKNAARSLVKSRKINKQEDYIKGWNSLLEAIEAPYKKILSNAGINSVEDYDKGIGINVLTGKTVNMIEDGIIDPAKITKQALINAVSVAKTILGTDTVICNIE